MAIIKKVEYHRVNSICTYDIPDEDIIEEFGSIENFETEMYDETDAFWEFMNSGWDYDRDDDWWTDRKGGYEVDWELEGGSED